MVKQVGFGKHPEAKSPKSSDEFELSIVDQFDQYFNGNRFEFEIPYQLMGTPFQIAVWKGMLDIQYGDIDTYSDLAEKIGYPQASRAVGTALNKNPLPIIIPCHRVIGKDGSLRGFAGGLALKQRLIDMEKEHRK